MSEIEKMYENAIGKVCTHTVINPERYNKRRMTRCCGCDYYAYPSFTAEKQIEIVKFLLAKDIFKCYQHYTSKAYIVLTDDVKDFICNKPFDEFLASYINYLWLSLTDKEKQQVKGILE